MSESRIQEKIDQITKSRQAYLSHDALAAKLEYDKSQELGRLSKDSALSTDMAVFNDNVTILGRLFEKSRFDQIIILLSKPQQLFFVNLLIGFFRGVGFVLGIVMIVVVMILVSGVSVSEMIQQFMQMRP